MPVPLVVFLILTALFCGATLFFWSVVRRRDRVFPPEERVYGRGRKRALLIFQPSLRNGAEQVAQALIRALVRAGHTVTVNRPSPQLKYDPAGFDLLVFGGASYMGGVGKPLADYLSELHYTGKRVLLYVTGELEQTPELAALRLCIPPGNTVRTMKARPSEGGKLAEWAAG